MFLLRYHFQLDLVILVWVLAITLQSLDRYHICCKPVIRPLENPNLFGGDMVGISKRIYQRDAEMCDTSKWHNGVIPFVIDPEIAIHKRLIYKAMNKYHQYTCVRFVRRRSEYDYILIRPLVGCYSDVGRIGGMQNVSLGAGCYNIGTVLHELGHVVGFSHEHQRNDRDKYIHVNFDNVIVNEEKQLETDNKICNKTRYIVYDYNSIMHYGPTAFGKKDYKTNKSLTTILPINGNNRIKEVSDKTGFSEPDKVKINYMYKC